MGCENSKTVRVQPVGPASVSRDNTNFIEAKTGATQTPEVKKRSRNNNNSGLRRSDTDATVEYELDEHGNKVSTKKKSKRPRSAKTRDAMGSCDTLDDTRSLGSDRGFSASSKQSADSGLGEDYAHVITEYSHEEQVRRVENSFVPREDLELGVTGVQVGTRLSAKNRSRLEESQIMQSLREEGLISKPKAESSGGMCFEIVTVSASGDGDGVRPPPRLEKLEQRRKKKRQLTEDEIRDKLERAERRRKKREQEKLEKIREMERTDALAAVDHFAQYQRSKEENLVQKLDQAQDNKERQRRERQEKLDRRKRHAEEVRRRKQQAQESGTYVDHTEEGEATAAMMPDMTSAAERPSSRSSSRGSNRSSSSKKRRE